MVQQTRSQVLESLNVVRRQLDGLDFPFDSAESAAARHEIDDLLALLTRYALPRLERPDAPLLLAVTGSTGAGKSMIVNALVGDVVSAPGVLRPTTRIPVLIHHPDDAEWFGGEGAQGWLADEQVLVDRLAADGLPQGVAVLDTPPLGSIDGDVRLAVLGSLLAADLWLYVTTAARYADALPWEMLAEAVRRRASVAVLLNRVPDGALKDLRGHLATLLAARGLGDAPLFAVDESDLDSSGMLPAQTVEPVRRWVRDLAGHPQARAAVAARTVDGAIDDVLNRVVTLASGTGIDLFGEEERAALASAADDVQRTREEQG